MNKKTKTGGPALGKGALALREPRGTSSIHLPKLDLWLQSKRRDFAQAALRLTLCASSPASHCIMLVEEPARGNGRDETITSPISRPLGPRPTSASGSAGKSSPRAHNSTVSLHAAMP